MRLIDELLKDDFFRGGYQPGEKNASSRESPSGGPRKMIFIAVAVLLLAGLGGGGYFFFAPKSKAPVITAVPVPAKPAPAKAVPGAADPAAPEAESLAAADSVNAASTKTDAAAEDDAIDESTGAPDPKTAAQPPAERAAAEPADEPAKVQPKAVPQRAPEPPPARVQNYAITVEAMTSKTEANRIAGLLRAKKLTPTIETTQARTAIFSIHSAKAVEPAEFNAIKLKASLFKLPLKETTGTGGVTYELGNYGSRSDAEKVLAIAERAGIPATVSEKAALVPAYAIKVAGFSDQGLAEQTASALSADGIRATVKRDP